MTRLPTTLAALATAAALIAGEAAAQIIIEPSPARPGPAPSASRPAAVSGMASMKMTGQELLACARRIQAAERDEVALRADGAALGARKARLAQAEREIAAQRAKVNHRDKAQVAAFSARTTQHSSTVRAFNSDILARNRRAAAFNEAIALFNIACSDRAFDEKDFTAMPSDLQAAMKGNTKATMIPVTE